MKPKLTPDSDADANEPTAKLPDKPEPATPSQERLSVAGAVGASGVNSASETLPPVIWKPTVEVPTDNCNESSDTANNDPLVEAPPLARALYATTELGREIPAALYVAVAQVLAYVYQLKQARAQGETPPAVPTPEVDPDLMGPYRE